MKVTRTGMTTVIAQAYASYKRSGPVEETKPAMAGGTVMGEQMAGNWLMNNQQNRQRPEPPAPIAEQPNSKASLSTSTLSLPRKGGTDILV